MMNLFRALREWVDHDWERHNYIPTFAFAQKLLFLSPLLLLGIVSMAIDIPPGSPSYYWSLGIAGALCLIIGIFQAWRWIRGYGPDLIARRVGSQAVGTAALVTVDRPSIRLNL